MALLEQEGGGGSSRGAGKASVFPTQETVGGK